RHLLLKDGDDADTLRNHAAISEDFFYFFSPDKERASGRIIDEFAMWATYVVWGNNLAALHLLNVCFHALASFSLALCFRSLGAAMVTSLIGGLLFLVNVSHLQPVHWISALEYPIAALLAAWTLYLYARFTRSRRRLYLYLFYTGLTGSILAHSILLLTWPICLFYSHGRGDSWRVAIRYLLPILPVLALALIFVSSRMGSDTATTSALNSYVGSIAQAEGLISLLVETAQAFVVPLGRLVFMAYWLPADPTGQGAADLWLGMCVLIALLYSLWSGRAMVRLWSLWVLLFISPFVIAMLAAPTGVSRYVYLASIGTSALLAMAMNWGRKQMGRVGSHVLLLVLLAILWSSYNAEQRVANRSRYDSGRYYTSYGGDPDHGIALMLEAIATDASLIPLGEAYYVICNELLSSGGDFSSILNEARAVLPNDDRIIALYAVVESQSLDDQRREEATQTLDNMLGLSREMGPIERAPFCSMVAKVFHNLALGLEKHGHYDGALDALEAALIWQSNRENTLRVLYKLHLKMGRAREAAESVERMLALDPTNYKMYYVLGQIYALQQDRTRSYQAYQSVLHLAPNSGEAEKVRALLR
ncbi:MAG: hypothetical protein ACI8PG_004357, partial [Planctomycetota bacterium]